MQAFQLALSFLTIIPSGLKAAVDKRAFGQSLAFFPVVGAILGAILAAISLVLDRLDPLTASAVIIVALIILTRAFHLDGLADSFDGLFGGYDKERILEIMKDSRIGSFGVIALIAVILLKVVFLSQVPRDMLFGALVIFPVLGRWAAVYSITTQPSARSTGGLGSLYREGSGNRALYIALTIASVIAFGLAIALLRTSSIIVIPAVIAFATVYNIMIKRKIGGITGDTAGALIELSETLVLMVIAIFG